MATEKSPLVTKVTIKEASMQDMRPNLYGNEPFTHIDASTDLDSSMPNVADLSPRGKRSGTIDSVTSDYGPYTTSLSSNPGDIHELLRNLEKATALVKRHVTLEQEEPPRRARRALIPHWLTSYLLIITFIWQSVNIGVLEIIYRVTPRNTTLEVDLNLASNIVMTIFQFVHLLLVFFISVKLAKQVIHRSASGSLLAQSYLSTVLLFAGLYTLEYRLDGGIGWVIGTGKNDFIPDPLSLFLRMFYLSVSTATLCGTSQVEPIVWYTDITVSLQMLASFVYFASILSLGVMERKRSKYDPPPGRWRSFTGKIRRCIFRDES